MFALFYYLLCLVKRPPRWAQMNGYFGIQSIVTKKTYTNIFQCLTSDCLVVK